MEGWVLDIGFRSFQIEATYWLYNCREITESVRDKFLNSKMILIILIQQGSSDD